MFIATEALREVRVVIQKKHLKIFSAIPFILVVAFSAMAADPAGKGPHAVCRFSERQHLITPEYHNAVIYFPCEKKDGPFAATTVTGGWTNVLEDMNWISRHVVTHGYVVIAITPNDNMGKNPEWRRAHNAGLAKLKSENQRKNSPIYGLVNTDALQIMGFSKGGGGALMAGADQREDVKSIQAMAPYADGGYDFSGIKGATLLITSRADRLAPAQKVHTMFASLPTHMDRTLASFRGFRHLEWLPVGLAENHKKALTLIVAWMKVYLDGDHRYARYMDGRQSGWFDEFWHYPAEKKQGK